MADFSIVEYFERIVPEQFAAAIAEKPEAGEQPELKATYVIEGEGGATYGLRIAGGKLEVVPGGIEGSDITTTTGVQEWISATDATDRDLVVDLYIRGKVQAVKNLQGVVHLDLTREDGSPYTSTLVLGGVSEPEVTMRMTTSDYVDMMHGRLNGQMAFMTGKLKFEGNLPLLMKLGTISA